MLRKTTSERCCKCAFGLYYCIFTWDLCQLPAVLVPFLLFGSFSGPCLASLHFCSRSPYMESMPVSQNFSGWFKSTCVPTDSWGICLYFPNSNCLVFCKTFNTKSVLNPNYSKTMRIPQHNSDPASNTASPATPNSWLPHDSPQYLHLHSFDHPDIH